MQISDRRASETRPVILVVDDEALVRMFAADFLDEAGYKIFEAVDAEEALALLHARPDVRAVFTDVEMGTGMNGFDLARTVRERWPGIAVLLVSGRMAPTAADVPDGAQFISKPYSPAAVLASLREMVQS